MICQLNLDRAGKKQGIVLVFGKFTDRHYENHVNHAPALTISTAAHVQGKETKPFFPSASRQSFKGCKEMAAGGCTKMTKTYRKKGTTRDDRAHKGFRPASPSPKGRVTTAISAKPKFRKLQLVTLRWMRLIP